MSWRERFGMHATPLPRGAVGESFFEGDPHYQRLAQGFAWLASEPGIGVLTGEPGVGKTSAIRHLCRALPASEHRVVYLCDCAVKPLDLYRMLAAELGLRPGPRAQIVADIKRALVSLVDERGVVRGRAQVRCGARLKRGRSSARATGRGGAAEERAR
jgi:MSHA biogenesis protein MshM